MKFSVNFDSTPLESKEKATVIRAAGFDCTFVWWSRTDGQNLARVDAARSAGLEIETAHTDFHGINAMWLDNADGEEQLAYYMRSIDEAAECGIPTLIVHLSSGNTPPPINRLGTSRFLSLVRRAEERGVTLAFENLRKVEYLDAMLAAAGDSPAAAFCFDIGHENIYNGSRDILERYGSRLAAFHLHDNHGESDEHLLPFCGSIAWETAAKRIAPYLKKVPLTIEAYAADGCDPRVFYTLAMQRAKELAELVSRHTK